MLQESIFTLALGIAFFLSAHAVRILIETVHSSRLTNLKIMRAIMAIAHDKEAHKAHLDMHAAEKEHLKGNVTDFMKAAKQLVEAQLKEMREHSDRPWEKDGP